MTKITKCPGPIPAAYKPDAATLIAQERAAKAQPRLISMTSKVAEKESERLGRTGGKA